MKKQKAITAAIASKVLKTVDVGLVCGLGHRTPGRMCVEAAVAYAMGEPHGDRPACVDYPLRTFKINLNDHDGWDDASNPDKARSKGLRRIAIAQLGSANKLDWGQFVNDLVGLIYARYASKQEKRELEKFCVARAAVVTLVKNITGEDSKGNAENELAGLGDAPPLLMWGEADEFAQECVGFVATRHKAKDATLKAIRMVAELAVKALIKQGIPGTKYLYLTERRKTKVRRKK